MNWRNLSNYGELAPYDEWHFGVRVFTVLPHQKQWQHLFRENKSKTIPNPVKCCGCDPLTIKSNGFVDFSRFWNEPVFGFKQDENKNNVFNNTASRYQSANNRACFTDENLVFSAWFILFIYWNIYGENFCKNRYQNSLIFSSPLLYDLSMTVFLGNAEAWSVSLCFNTHFLLCAHVPSLASAGMHYVCS